MFKRRKNAVKKPSKVKKKKVEKVEKEEEGLRSTVGPDPGNGAKWSEMEFIEDAHEAKASGYLLPFKLAEELSAVHFDSEAEVRLLALASAD